MQNTSQLLVTLSYTADPTHPAPPQIAISLATTTPSVFCGMLPQPNKVIQSQTDLKKIKGERIQQANPALNQPARLFLETARTWSRCLSLKVAAAWRTPLAKRVVLENCLRWPSASIRVQDDCTGPRWAALTRCASEHITANSDKLLGRIAIDSRQPVPEGLLPCWLCFRET